MINICENQHQIQRTSAVKTSAFRKRVFLLSLYLSFASVILLQAQHPDTLQVYLGEITVIGYEANRSILETPGAVSFIDAGLIAAFDRKSVLFGLNTVPGVRMEQRAPGSYRIAIRGSSLRSPFGIRNVKIYWNDIPLTEPSGNSFLNLLDVSNILQAEIIRGPAGSMYGAGNGGVLLLSSKTVPSAIEAGTSFGSFGYQRYSLHAQNQFENGNLRLNYARQHSDGYREQSFLNRETAELSGNYTLNERQEVSSSFLFSDLHYGIPGALTRAQMQENPRQARPGNPFTLGSVEANSSIRHQQFLAGITHHFRLAEPLQNKTSVFGAFSNFDHPFNLDYKKDSRKSGGIRSLFQLNHDFGAVKSTLTLGGEIHASEYAARNFDNDFGETGALNFDDQIGIQSTLLFANAEIDLPHQFYLSAGLSYNRLEYSLNRLITNLGNDISGLAEKDFMPEIIPRIGLVKKFSPAISIHGSMSYGFSPPTIEEFRTNEGSINMDLEAERGMNYEAGLRGFLQQGRFSYDVTMFYFQLDETIVQQQSERGTVLFENAGSTHQFGVEVAASWVMVSNYQGFLETLRWDNSYTFHHLTFHNYNRDGNDFSGNKLTGVAPHSFVSSLKTGLGSGVYGMLSYNFMDKIPLNDANSVYADAYHLVQAKIGYGREILPTLHLDAHFGIDNLLNENYSLGNDLNAFGERYYQPAASRNWFAGIRLNKKL